MFCTSQNNDIGYGLQAGTGSITREIGWVGE